MILAGMGSSYIIEAVITLQSISVPGCVECRKFEEWWKEAAKDFPDVRYENIDATNPAGQELVLKHQIFASPGIVVNGELFSTGGVNKEALIKRLNELRKPS